MKKLMFIGGLVALGIFSGCSATDKVYDATKGVYNTGKGAVKLMPFDPATKVKLKAIDGVATSYDATRTKVRGLQDANQSR